MEKQIQRRSQARSVMPLLSRPNSQRYLNPNTPKGYLEVRCQKWEPCRSRLKGDAHKPFQLQGT